MKLLTAVPKISNPATAVQAGKDILKELPKVTKQVKNKEFLNMQVVTADPMFKIPDIPPIPPLPDPEAEAAKLAQGIKIPKKPSITDLTDKIYNMIKNKKYTTSMLQKWFLTYLYEPEKLQDNVKLFEELIDQSSEKDSGMFT